MNTCFEISMYIPDYGWTSMETCDSMEEVQDTSRNIHAKTEKDIPSQKWSVKKKKKKKKKNLLAWDVMI